MTLMCSSERICRFKTKMKHLKVFRCQTAYQQLPHSFCSPEQKDALRLKRVSKLHRKKSHQALK